MTTYICDNCNKEVEDFVTEDTYGNPDGYKELCEVCHPIVVDAKKAAKKAEYKAGGKAYDETFLKYPGIQAKTKD